MEIDESFVPATKKCVEPEELDDGCILYGTEKDEVHSLNSTAASAWTCCDGKHSVKEIVNVVEEFFKSESKIAPRDIIKIIENFSKKELLAPKALDYPGTWPFIAYRLLCIYYITSSIHIGSLYR